MAITKSDLRVIELVLKEAKDEAKRVLANVQDENSRNAHLLEGRVDGLSRAWNLIKEEFAE